MKPEHYSLLLAKDIKPAGTIDVVAPFDRSVIATIDYGNDKHIEQALTTAYACYQDRSQWIATPKRIEILENVIKLMTEQHDHLAIESAREGGKPLVDSLAEVTRAIDGIKICIETLRTNSGEVIPMDYNAASANRIAFTQREPIGVVVAVSAFNHPVNLIVHQVGSAVAAGCPVIVKPASDTPLSCMRMVEIFHKAGLPKQWCQAMVIEDNNLATNLVADERVAFLTFIGSAKVGWMLRSKLAPGTRCALEHGGVAPVIVDSDADIAKVIPPLTKGGFYHAGQVCVSVQRVYVHQSIAEKLAKALADSASQLRVGDPTRKETDVGPIIRPAELKRIDEWVQEAIKQGAKVLCGAEAISETCYKPTVLFNPPDDATISTHEIFGPVVCVYSYKTIDEAIERANALPYSFQGAIFSNNIANAMHIYQNLAASTIMLNDHTAFRVDGMPFAGLKLSGLGVGGIPYSIHDMQVEKMLVMKL